MKDDRQKDREDGDWNQEFRKQKVTENENSDDDGQREQNSRWLESLEKVRHSENATEQSMPFRNARKHTTKYEQQQRESHRATTQATTTNNKIKDKRQKTIDNNCRSRLLRLRNAEQGCEQEQKKEGEMGMERRKEQEYPT